MMAKTRAMSMLIVHHQSNSRSIQPRMNIGRRPASCGKYQLRQAWPHNSASTVPVVTTHTRPARIRTSAVSAGRVSTQVHGAIADILRRKETAEHQESAGEQCHPLVIREPIDGGADPLTRARAVPAPNAAIIRPQRTAAVGPAGQPDSRPSPPGSVVDPNMSPNQPPAGISFRALNSWPMVTKKSATSARDAAAIAKNRAGRSRVAIVISVIRKTSATRQERQGIAQESQPIPPAHQSRRCGRQDEQHDIVVTALHSEYHRGRKNAERDEPCRNDAAPCGKKDEAGNEREIHDEPGRRRPRFRHGQLREKEPERRIVVDTADGIAGIRREDVHAPAEQRTAREHVSMSTNGERKGVDAPPLQHGLVGFRAAVRVSATMPMNTTAAIAAGRMRRVRISRPSDIGA